jgi:hypothetical protein
MIPLPPAVKNKILAWLPHVLAGYDYPVIETDNIVPCLEAPAITYYLSSVGIPSEGSNQIIRTVRNRETGGLDDYWGQWHAATMNVVLRANDKDELSRIWEAFIRKCLATRRDLLLRIDGVQFDEILNSAPLAPERLDNGKDLYWAQVDLKFTYEMSDVSEAEYIKTVYTDLCVQTAKPASHLLFERAVLERELSVGITATIVDNN